MLPPRVAALMVNGHFAATGQPQPDGAHISAPTPGALPDELSQADQLRFQRRVIAPLSAQRFEGYACRGIVSSADQCESEPNVDVTATDSANRPV